MAITADQQTVLRHFVAAIGKVTVVVGIFDAVTFEGREAADDLVWYLSQIMGSVEVHAIQFGNGKLVPLSVMLERD